MALIVVLPLLFAAIAVYAYLGGFSKLTVRTEKTGGETLVYKQVTGSYNKLGPVTDEIYYYLLNDLNIETYKGFGIFYDDPRRTDKSKLRADAGCIVEAKDVERLKKAESKYPVKTLPVTAAIVAEFPYKGGVSLLFGYLKVVPAIEKYGKEQQLESGPLVSIVDVPGKRIIYRKIVTNGHSGNKAD